MILIVREGLVTTIDHHRSLTSLKMSELMMKINLTPTCTGLSPVNLPTIKYHICHSEKCWRGGRGRDKCRNPFGFFYWREVWFLLREIKVECPHVPPLCSLYIVVYSGVSHFTYHNILSRTGTTGTIRNTNRQPQHSPSQLELLER